MKEEDEEDEFKGVDLNLKVSYLNIDYTKDAELSSDTFDLEGEGDGDEISLSDSSK